MKKLAAILSKQNGSPPKQLPPWLYIPTNDYDMDCVKAQWWADDQFGVRGAR